MSKFFFTTGSKGVIYTTAEEMAAFLDIYPEAVDAYWNKTWELIRGVMAWGDFETPKEMFNIALEAVHIHEQRRGAVTFTKGVENAKIQNGGQ